MKNFLRVFILGLTLSFSIASLAFAATSVEGDVVEYDFRSGQAVAKGHVVLKSADTRVEAEEAEYNTKTEAGKLTGGVIATQPDGKATCNTLILHAGGDRLTAVGNAVFKKQDKTLRAEQVEYYQSREYMETVGSWAQLSMDDGSTLEAGYINFDQKTGVANATGGVRITSEVRKLTASCDRAVYNTKLEDGTIELIGNAKATQDGDSVSGNTLMLKGAGGGEKIAAANKQVMMAEGNVKMVYVPKPQPKKTGRETDRKPLQGSAPKMAIA